MSYIRVIVDEQNLHITDSPKIAAQGVNENYIVFDFDATWSGFSKVALFYREGDESQVYKSLIVDNQAVVPHEVTDQEGKICFGICGVKGDKVYTSEILKYKVVKGLYTSGQESEPPTPGIYEQMLQSLDVMRAQVDNLVQNYNVEYGSKTLWEGELYWAGSSVVPWEDADLTRTLSDNVYDFDYVDIYLAINSSTQGVIGRFLFTLPKVEADLLYPILFSYGSKLSGLESGNHNLNACRFTVKFPTSRTINLYEAAVWLWNGSAADDATINRLGGHGFCITKVVGRKIVANAEVTDIRIGADGTVYQTAGEAVRAQAFRGTDQTLSISGKAADAKAVGDEISDLKSAFCDYNCIDALSLLNGENRTLYGVTFTWNSDGSCTVTGTATNTVFSNLWFDTTHMPPFFKPGSVVHVKVSDTTKTSLKLWFYKNGTYNSGYSVTESRDVLIPSDAEGMLIRLQVDKDVVVDETIKYIALTSFTNDDIYNQLKQNVLDKRLFAMDTIGLPSCNLNDVLSDAHILIDTETYENAPASIGFLNAYHTAGLCLQVFYSFTSNKVWKRRMVNNVWSSWVEIGSGTTNNYTFQNYENSYNVSATPVINASNENYLAPTGTDEDVTASIITMLNTSKVCRLGPGNYYVKNLVMPNNSSIIGCGAATHIFLTEAEDGFAIKLGNRCAVKDCWIMGTETEITPSETLGNRHGILWQGSYTADGKAPIRGLVSGLHITGFTGGGITCYDTGYSVNTCMEVDDCYIYNCGAGINISYWSEFHKFANVHCTSNYYGCINNGGNNTFIGCDFSGNKLAFLMDNANDQSPNNSHGSAVGCVFNHTDNNSGVGIKILNCKNGYIFTGCQIFFSRVHLEDSDGVTFGSCNFGNVNCDIEISGGGAILFNGNMHQAQPTKTITNNSNVHFVNCYVRSTGAVVS